MSEEIQRIMVRQNHSNDYIIRMAREISDPDDFADEFQLFAGAGPNDTINLQVVSGGGRVDTCHMIRRAMEQCEAKIVGWIGPMCASAASAIILACDEWEVDDMSSFMVHTGSYATGWGKSPDVVAYAAHQDKMVTKFIRTTYTGFLTEEEIVKVIDGKEFWFEGEELVQRLVKFSEYREQQRVDGVQAMKQQILELEAQLAELAEQKEV